MGTIKYATSRYNTVEAENGLKGLIQVVDFNGFMQVCHQVAKIRLDVI